MEDDAVEYDAEEPPPTSSSSSLSQPQPIVADTPHPPSLAAETSTYDFTTPDSSSSSSNTRLNIDSDNVASWTKRRRLELLDDLATALDTLIIAHIAIIYHLDNSFFRFALRCLTQVTYLMPRTSTLLPDAPTRPNTSAILAVNILCVGCHLYFEAPHAGEATRGYMHGGLMLDLIGQHGPTSKVRLVVMDVVIVILQCVALAAMLKRVEVARSATGPIPPEDLDTAERGVVCEDEAPTIVADRLWAGQSAIADLYILDVLSSGGGGGSAISTTTTTEGVQRSRSRWRLNIPT